MNYYYIGVALQNSIKLQMKTSETRETLSTERALTTSVETVVAKLDKIFNEWFQFKNHMDQMKRHTDCILYSDYQIETMDKLNRDLYKQHFHKLKDEIDELNI